MGEPKQAPKALPESVPADSLPKSPSVFSSFSASDYYLGTIVLATAAIVRTYALHLPPKVVFDETHFGGFAKNYFDGAFFVDVHPPLVKIVFYAIAAVLGWDGQFEFANIGDVYDASVPYLPMRLFSALSGVVAAVLAYFALRASGCRAGIAVAGALLGVFENSLATLARVIMLDSGLIAFTALAVLAFQQFQTAKPFTRKWYKTMLATGVALGLAASTKLTGWFTVVWVLLWSAVHVWSLLGDLNVSITQCIFHGLLRLVAFVVVPITIYCGFFSLHFMLLPFNGTGSGYMLPLFKAGLVDSDSLRNTAVDVSYGSTVTIKHNRLNAYLHSHDATYKTGTGQQQVTMYGFEPDYFNQWVIEPHGETSEGELETKFDSIEDGRTVKLFHKGTGRYLRVNDVRPPNSEHDYSNEVSCHGNRSDADDINYEWTLKLVDKKSYSENELPLRKLRATESVFQLVHRSTHCTLVGHDVKLPEWGFEQNQVLCILGPTLPNTLWYIETNNHPVIDGDVEKYPRVALPELLFFQKIAEYHIAMWHLNKSLTKKHDYSSMPLSWPFATRGIAFFSNGRGDEKLTDEDGSHIYFLGNIVVYYGGLLALVVIGFNFLFYILSSLNPFSEPSKATANSALFTTVLQYASGWALNFIPYMHMSRQLFAHHYLTSVFFLTLTVSQLVEYKASGNKSIWSSLWIGTYGVLLVGVVFFFYKFSPLVYGSSWTVKQCQDAKWLPGWDFDCMAYSQ